MSNLIQRLRVALANRRAYHRALDEIALIDERELQDMHADREMLVAGAYRQVYGRAA